jgi:hypothetical protein
MNPRIDCGGCEEREMMSKPKKYVVHVHGQILKTQGFDTKEEMFAFIRTIIKPSAITDIAHNGRLQTYGTVKSWIASARRSLES